MQERSDDDLFKFGDNKRVIIDAHAHVFDRLCGLTGCGATEPLTYGKAKLTNGKVLRFLPPLAVETRFPAEVLLEYR